MTPVSTTYPTNIKSLFTHVKRRLVSREIPVYVSTVGGELRKLREAAGLQQTDVAEKLNVSRVSVSNWERDVTLPSDDNFEQLARLFGVSTASLRYPADVTPPLRVTDREVQPPTPRVSAGLPHALRRWLQDELTEYVKARIPDHLFIEARSALESPELIGFFVGGGGGETSEDDVLEDMKLMARAIRRRLRRGGAKLGPDPVD